MSNNNFVKGECRHCGGHLEFPANAAGETVECPHCGRPTELNATISPDKPKSFRRMGFGLGIAVFLIGVGLAAVLVRQKGKGPGVVSETQTVPASPTNNSAATVTPPASPVMAPGEERTNDFAISAVRLEKTPGSSLVYVTGKVGNLSGRQRFGVKVEFGLFDTNDNPVGKATDYQPVLEPHGDWRFKAMVMETKAVSARLNLIQEDQ